MTDFSGSSAYATKTEIPASQKSFLIVPPFFFATIALTLVGAAIGLGAGILILSVPDALITSFPSHTP